MNYRDGFFDCAYCFHSTWYFPDLGQAIDEMLRVTRLGGLVMFDIQNRNNDDVNNAYLRKSRLGRLGRLGGTALDAHYENYREKHFVQA